MPGQIIHPSLTANVTRRRFLQGITGTILCATGEIDNLFAQNSTTTPGEPVGQLIARQRNPDNLEFPFDTLNSFTTPNEKFYVRNHFAQPKLDVDFWKLKIEGAVQRELDLKLDEIRNLPSQTVTAMLECAGNGRAFLVPKMKGVPWQLGAVGNADWTGVPLSAVLDRAGLRDRAVEVVLEGADSGEITADIKPAGPIHFARSLPLAKARAPEVILAYKMNGADLPPTHGFPLRAVVPGWYGVASIKWLTRLVVLDRPFNGYFQSIDYSYFSKEKGLSRTVPITQLEVKAQIARPTAGEIIKAGTDYRIHGAAWTGEAEIVKVEISTDGGKSWKESHLSEDGSKRREIRSYGWRLWSFIWRTPNKTGPVRVMARATDSQGQVQPLERDPDRRNYMISHVLPVDVVIQ